MATRIVTRAIQQASQTPLRLLPFLHQQSFAEPSFVQAAEKTDQSLSSQLVFAEQSQQPWVSLGFPPLTDSGRSPGSFFLFNKLSPQSALAPHLDVQLQTQFQKLELDPPLLNKDSAPEPLWKLTNSHYLPPSSEIDEVILPSYHEDTSPMLMSTKRTFNPSTLVRKRRHGFLARKATVGGRRILARRFLKGRRRLSA